MNIETYEPVGGKNSEEYRSALMVKIQQLKQKEEYSRSKASSKHRVTPIILIIASVLLLAMSSFVSAIGIIIGIIWLISVISNEKQYLNEWDYYSKERIKAQEYYDYALKHKDKDIIYEDNPLMSVRLY